uniref:Uncharacterized protein n=1 Tax=Amphimedon queenslandica TaxID=400682 RepID=A0A1X7SMD1_AMPQE
PTLANMIAARRSSLSSAESAQRNLFCSSNRTSRQNGYRVGRGFRTSILFCSIPTNTSKSDRASLANSL